MKKNFGKNEAGNICKNKSAIMIVSILAVTLFIGMAVQPAMADPVAVEGTNVKVKTPQEQGPSCDSCIETAVFAIEYMVQHVKDNMNGVYFLWSVDATLLIFQGLILGIAESGFSPKIDEARLKATIQYHIKKLVGQQIFTVTKFLAALGAIAIGITSYFVSLCNNEEPSPIIPPVRAPRFNIPRAPGILGMIIGRLILG